MGSLYEVEMEKEFNGKKVPQVLVYDPNKNKVVQLRIAGESEKTTVDIEYCMSCELQGPEKMSVEVESQGQKVNMVIRVTKFKKPKSISEQLFQF